MRRIAALLFLSLGLAGLLQADEIRLKRGGRIRGKIREENEREIVIETTAGLTRVKREDIASIDRNVRTVVEEYYGREETAESADELEALAEWARNNGMHRKVDGLLRRAREKREVEFARRKMELPDNPPVDDLYRLGVWALEHGLEEGKSLLQRVIQKDPDHEFARRKLGFKRFEGRWLTEEEIMLAKGMVRFEGRWVTPAERELILKEREAKFEERERKLREAERRLERELAEVRAREAEAEAREKKARELEQEAEKEREEYRVLKRELQAYEDRLRRIFGDPAWIVPCPRCKIWWSRRIYRRCPWCEDKQDKDR